MATHSFPDDPSRRKVVLVLQKHEIERCAYERGAGLALRDEEACVLQFPVELGGQSSLALQNIVDAGLARPGSILVQNPYDADAYAEATVALQRFALAKHMYFSTFCMHLGAKEVVVEQVELRTRSGRSTLDAKGERLGVSAQVSVETEELEKFRAQMHLRDEFDGGPPDVMLAERLLRRTGLLADPNLRTLIEMRRDGANQLKARKLVLSLSSEARSNLNVVGRLKVPAFVKLTAEYSRVVKEEQDYTLTVVVKF